MARCGMDAKLPVRCERALVGINFYAIERADDCAVIRTWGTLACDFDPMPEAFLNRGPWPARGEVSDGAAEASA
jgi:hypothetical protein